MSLPGRRAFQDKLELHLSPDEVKAVMRAYRFSKYGHRPQQRDGGDRYFDHCKSVALILIDELRVYDAELIIAALLHDIREDSWILTYEDIREFWGKRVERIVRVVTKSARRKNNDAYHRRIARADRDAKLVKLADRLHNVRTLWSCDAEKREKQIAETRMWYLPIAQQTEPYLAREIEKALRKAEKLRRQ